MLETLLRDCAPATIGRSGENVLDESYRQASKLDASAFATSFCPYTLGIVDTAAQLLMACISIDGLRAVRAELYKLNIYAAPSGHFKVHVDTPRSERQFGSLVVCLPCPHAGGALVLHHAGRSITYDWSMTDDDVPAIHWAAFYSDCEHEVLEVTAGHRVTLTYNLFVATNSLTCLDVSGLPLCRAVKHALNNPSFLPDGGTIGCYCRHWYPHAAKAPKDAPIFPSILKGSDLYLYCVFVKLGLKVEVRPVVVRPNNYILDPSQDRPFIGDASCGTGTVETDLGGYGDDPVEEIFAAFGQQRQVHWLNAPRRGTEQVGFYHLAYGNETQIDHEYTFAALFVHIDRKKVPASAVDAPQSASC